MLTNSGIAYRDHDHDYCVDDALHQAEVLCAERGQRFTALRQAVLELVWSSHKPLGAYEVIELLSQREQRRVMPPTVYRALDFLVELGLVHKISSLNAFIGCPFPKKHHEEMFLLCRNCGAAAECSMTSISSQLDELARQNGFQIETRHIELSGLCPRCVNSAQAADAAKTETTR